MRFCNQHHHLYQELSIVNRIEPGDINVVLFTENRVNEFELCYTFSIKNVKEVCNDVWEIGDF